MQHILYDNRKRDRKHRNTTHYIYINTTHNTFLVAQAVRLLVGARTKNKDSGMIMRCYSWFFRNIMQECVHGAMENEM